MENWRKVGSFLLGLVVVLLALGALHAAVEWIPNRPAALAVVSASFLTLAYWVIRWGGWMWSWLLLFPFGAADTILGKEVSLGIFLVVLLVIAVGYGLIRFIRNARRKWALDYLQWYAGKQTMSGGGRLYGVGFNCRQCNDYLELRLLSYQSHMTCGQCGQRNEIDWKAIVREAKEAQRAIAWTRSARG